MVEVVISDEVSAIFACKEPTRVLIQVKSTKTPSWLMSSEAIIHSTLMTLGLDDTKFIFLAHEKWSIVRRIVFDLFHDGYNYDLGHIVSNLPVVGVNYGSKGCKVFDAKFYQNQINKFVAKQHELNGWSVKLPFFADYTLPNPPQYKDPRHKKVRPRPESLKAEDDRQK